MRVVVFLVVSVVYMYLVMSSLYRVDVELLRDNSMSLDALNSGDNGGKVAVVVLGQIRGGSNSWETFVDHLVVPMQADLFTVGPSVPEFADYPINKQYVIQDPDDWGALLDEAAGNTDWRKYCLRNRQFLGGVKDCHKGSSGILLYYRWFLQSKLDDFKDYDWLVVTRGDYFYLCDFPEFRPYGSHIMIPNVEGYGGFTDRFAMIPMAMANEFLNVTNLVFHESKQFMDKVDGFADLNLERLIRMTTNYYKLPVITYDHPGFTVRADGDPTRWEKGHDDEDMKKFNLRVKYPTEKDVAKKICGN